MIVVSRPQMPVRDVCVDLRRRNITVSEQRLNGTRVGAALQQVSGKTVAQRVGRNINQTDLRGVGFDDGPGDVAS